jgi:flavin-dependent dehydrogenase
MAPEGARNEYDVIVVGAGFGGPVAAKKCAEAGLRTLMLERGGRAGEKVISGLTIPFYGFLFGPEFIRDGNPPIERPVDGIINYIIKDIDTGDIDIEDSLRIPKPLSPVIAFGYNAYCQPFCEWEAERAVESGAELRTSTVAVNVLRENGCVRGVVTDAGDSLGAKVVIDAEGCQGLLAIKAGIREKYPPDTISLADVYDYEMAKEDVDRIFGHTLRFCWGWDEQRVAPPLGYGNGLMVWPYRNSLHFIQDQCLKAESGKVPSLKDFDEYHRNITTRVPWWKDDVAPHINLRSRMWDGFEIYVGLDEDLRNMPNHTDGMILIGDAAGLESTELCDGVPAAWFSAEIAADVAIEAIRAGDTSTSFLKRYDERIRAHPIIQWSISRTNRHDLRYAQRDHDEKRLKALIHNGWGLGGFTHMSTPIAETMLGAISEDPAIVTSWIRMYFRYFYNWLYERFGEHHGELPAVSSGTQTAGHRAFKRSLESLDRVLERFSSPIKRAAAFVAPASVVANPVMKALLPILEPVYLVLVRILEPVTDPLSNKLIDFVNRADPSMFDSPRKKGVRDAKDF